MELAGAIAEASSQCEAAIASASLTGEVDLQQLQGDREALSVTREYNAWLTEEVAVKGANAIDSTIIAELRIMTGMLKVIESRASTCYGGLS